MTYKEYMRKHHGDEYVEPEPFPITYKENMRKYHGTVYPEDIEPKKPHSRRRDK